MRNSSTQWVQCREAHYVRHFGPLTTPPVLASCETVPLAVYQFKPHGSRDHWTLITGGMSDQPQHLPEATPDYVSPRTEIVMYVKEPRKWMFDVLTGLAELPFRNRTHLHWWHAIPNGMPMTPEPSLLTNFFFIPPFCESVEFDSLTISGRKVHFLLLVPITDSELEHQLKHGSSALFKIFEKNDFNCVVDEQRKAFV